jgi:hypothetical protein
MSGTSVITYTSLVRQNKREERMVGREIRGNNKYEIKKSGVHEAGPFDKLKRCSASLPA